mmetsp:Transcript_846/g.1884  ORF Transcript_846/g.1884 Transcript_846/m.1884 type:complete len:265 (-) Transcript_846:1301-2095(-)
MDDAKRLPVRRGEAEERLLAARALHRGAGYDLRQGRGQGGGRSALLHPLLLVLLRNLADVLFASAQPPAPGTAPASYLEAEDADARGEATFVGCDPDAQRDPEDIRQVRVAVGEGAGGPESLPRRIPLQREAQISRLEVHAQQPQPRNDTSRVRHKGGREGPQQRARCPQGDREAHPEGLPRMDDGEGEHLRGVRGRVGALVEKERVDRRQVRRRLRGLHIRPRRKVEAGVRQQGDRHERRYQDEPPHWHARGRGGQSPDGRRD